MSGISDKTAKATCDCPSITGLQKTGESSTSVSYSWGSSLAATQYKLWFVRQEDSFTSGNYFATGNSYTFSNLPSGTYTFYFVAFCGDVSSGFVGVEEVVAN